MKKNLLYMAALLCCLFTFTSCGSDDDEPKVKTEATGTYTITFSPDFFKVVKHVNIYYKGKDGENKNDVVMTGTVWTKTVTSTRFPAELGFKIVIEPKEKAEIVDGAYTIEVKGAINGAVNTGGSFSNSQTMLNNSFNDTDKMLNWLKSNKEKSYGYKLGKDGNATQYTPTLP